MFLQWSRAKRRLLPLLSTQRILSVNVNVSFVFSSRWYLNFSVLCHQKKEGVSHEYSGHNHLSIKQQLENVSDLSASFYSKESLSICLLLTYLKNCSSDLLRTWQGLLQPIQGSAECWLWCNFKISIRFEQTVNSALCSSRGGASTLWLHHFTGEQT